MPRLVTFRLATVWRYGQSVRLLSMRLYLYYTENDEDFPNERSSELDPMAARLTADENQNAPTELTIANKQLRLQENSNAY